MHHHPLPNNCHCRGGRKKRKKRRRVEIEVSPSATSHTTGVSSKKRGGRRRRIEVSHASLSADQGKEGMCKKGGGGVLPGVTSLTTSESLEGWEKRRRV